MSQPQPQVISQGELNKLLPERLRGTKWEQLPEGIRISLAFRYAGKVPKVPGRPTPGYRPDVDGPIGHPKSPVQPPVEPPKPPTPPTPPR